MISVSAQTQPTPISGATIYAPDHLGPTDYTHRYQARTAWGSDGANVARLDDMVGSAHMVRAGGTAIFKPSPVPRAVLTTPTASANAPVFKASVAGESTSWSVMFAVSIPQGCTQALMFPGYVAGTNDQTGGYFRVWNGSTTTDPQGNGTGPLVVIFTVTPSRFDTWTNGAQLTTGTLAPSTNPSLQQIGVGPYTASANNTMTVYDIAAWPRILSPAEIATVTSTARALYAI